MNDEWQGVKLASVVFGGIGAMLGISYSAQMTRKQMFFALVAGLACAAVGPQFLEQVVLQKYFSISLTTATNNALAFTLGIGGMFIVPGIISLWQSFAANPLAFLDRLRGKPAAEPPESGDKP